MRDVTEDVVAAEELPDGDVVRLVLEQHARIRSLFDDVRDAKGQARADAFAELRATLAVHETAEQLVVRPVSRRLTGDDLTEARDAEERAASEALAELERLDVESVEFHRHLSDLQASVDAHAEAEEQNELPAILAGCSGDERVAMGRKLTAAERIAPTRPLPAVAGHAVTTVLTAPLASIVDRTRDAIRKAG